MIINKTPHPIHLYKGDKVETLQPVAPCPRVATTQTKLFDLDGVPVMATSFGAVQDLPAPADGTFLIVSRLVISACPDRRDLVCPDQLVRDDKGQIIGCRGFSI